MEITSFGNQLCKGEYKIHSRFNSAINFISGSTFAFVVNESIGAGPVNIVVKGIFPYTINSLEIDDKCFKLNGSEFSFDSEKCYDSSIEINKFDISSFFNSLELVERTLREKSSPQSLSFLFGPDAVQKVDNLTTFEVECRRIIRTGVDQVLYGDVITGVRMVKGLGPGLTPSGDDFNSGLLLAINFVKKINNCHPGIPDYHSGISDYHSGISDYHSGISDYHSGISDYHSGLLNCHSREGGNPYYDIDDMISQIYIAAIGKNHFTNSFLTCAANGYLFFKFRELISALMDSDVNKIINNTELVMTMGETSGADQLTGFLIGMKRFLK